MVKVGMNNFVGHSDLITSRSQKREISRKTAFEAFFRGLFSDWRAAEMVTVNSVEQKNCE